MGDLIKTLILGDLNNSNNNFRWLNNSNTNLRWLNNNNTNFRLYEPVKLTFLHMDVLYLGFSSPNFDNVFLIPPSPIIKYTRIFVSDYK